MAVSAKMFGQFLMCALNKEVDFAADTWKIQLHTGTVPDQDTVVYQSSLSNEVANGNGYTTGGATLTNASVGYTASTNVIKLDFDDVSWTSATISATYAVIYDSTPGSAATNPVLCYIDFGGTMSSTNGTFTIQFDSAGVCTITAS